jgi:hypothetical protein
MFDILSENKVYPSLLPCHEYKVHTKFFLDVLEGNKTYELRKNDRKVMPQIGNLINLCEYDLDSKAYTGRVVSRIVTHILFDYPGLEKDYFIMGLNSLEGSDIFGTSKVNLCKSLGKSDNPILENNHFVVAANKIEKLMSLYISGNKLEKGKFFFLSLD